MQTLQAETKLNKLKTTQATTNQSHLQTSHHPTKKQLYRAIFQLERPDITHRSSCKHFINRSGQFSIWNTLGKHVHNSLVLSRRIFRSTQTSRVIYHLFASANIFGHDSSISLVQRRNAAPDLGVSKRIAVVSIWVFY